ncbi:MAG: fatty acid desaturase [Pseudomonadota bacterium]
MASYFGLIAASIVGGHFLVSQPATPASIFVGALLVVFIGTRLRGLNNIVHECSHATFTRKRKENEFIGSLCASAVLGCFKDYRAEHLTHHKHLGDYERDLDLQNIKDLRLHDPLTRETVMRHITNPLLGRHLPYYLNFNLSRADGLGFQLMKMSILLGVVVFTAVLPLTSLIFVILPYSLVYSTLNYWADCMDHAGLIEGDDDLESSRNILAPFPLRALFFPRYDCFHLVHHLFPQVPARHLETTHFVLVQDEIYQSKQNAVGGAAGPEPRPADAVAPS